MEIDHVLGISKESILEKENNLWIGISFGNQWFTNENLTSLIELGLRYTKETLLILVPGRLFATNLKYFDQLSRAEALREAFNLEAQAFKEIHKIISRLNPEERGKIIITNYDDVATPTFMKQREELMREFSKQEDFYKAIMDIAADMLEARERTMSKDRAESVALYLLQELPLFLSGVQKTGTDTIHTAVLYPGLGKSDDLVISILNDDNFSSLKKRLMIINKTGIASVSS